MTKFKDIIQESVANREAFQETEELNEAILNKNLEQVFAAGNKELAKRLGMKLRFKLTNRNNYVTMASKHPWWSREYEAYSGSTQVGHLSHGIRGQGIFFDASKGKAEYTIGGSTSGLFSARDVNLMNQSISDQINKKFAKVMVAELAAAQKEIG